MGCGFSSVLHAEKSSEDLTIFGSDTPSRGSVKENRWSFQSPMNRDKALLAQQREAQNSKQSGMPNEKAIFLGTGESGKSTVFKQMRLCYGQGFTTYERQQYTKLIWSDTIRALRLLVDICDAERRNPEAPPELKEIVHEWIGEPDQPHVNDMNVRIFQSLNLTRKAFLEAEQNINDRTFLYNHIPIEPKTMPIVDEDVTRTVISQAMKGIPINGKFPESIMESKNPFPLEIPINREVLGDVAQDLWDTCPRAIKMLVQNNQLAMETNTAHFLNQLGVLRQHDYMASNDDILSARIKTTGISEAIFKVKKSTLLVMDVGGQRIERSKWIHSFDDVTCVLFVASVSEYDQVLDEDRYVNRLDEALEVFQQTVNSRWFRNKSVQLFLNKTDILAQKCKYSSFRSRFQGYKGNDANPDEIIAYIESMFRARFVVNSRNLYVHRTCATDTNTMKFVVNAVSDMILFENMKWAGMI